MLRKQCKCGLCYSSCKCYCHHLGPNYLPETPADMGYECPVKKTARERREHEMTYLGSEDILRAMREVSTRWEMRPPTVEVLVPNEMVARWQRRSPPVEVRIPEGMSWDVAGAEFGRISATSASTPFRYDAINYGQLEERVLTTFFDDPTF